MDVDLIIRYQHDVNDQKEHVCTGSMFYRHEDGSRPPWRQWEFEKVSFNKLLAEASNRMNKDEAANIQRIIIERTDRQGLQPIVLDNPTKEILKIDPALAIRLLNYDGPAVHGKGGIKREHVAPPPMRVGYDSLSESLGEEVYVRQHRNLVECPGCGMWSTANQPFTCKKKCLISTVPVTYTEQWAKFKVMDLLKLGLPRYYLPRSFNKTKPWISAQDLLTLYETWKQVAKQNEETAS